jgi:hypothetical protein
VHAHSVLTEKNQLITTRCRPFLLPSQQDDKSAANDFQETLERIVNEIRNTTVRFPAR